MLESKTEKLKSILREIGRAAVTLSGGVDSSYLASAAAEVLGDNAAAVTVSSPLLPARDKAEAVRLAQNLGAAHAFIETDELADERFRANPKDKCYICKRMRLEMLSAWAKERDIPWLLDGSNVDDLSDYRPGMKALKEFPNVRSPLLEAGIGKQEIRELSKRAGLSVWNKPAAACLASRISSDQPITPENLRQVEDAEEFLYSLLPEDTQLRVRHHGQVARIEIDGRFTERVAARSDEICGFFGRLGFKHTALDLSGYRKGSMND